MADYILASGNTATFRPPFGAATVVPQPGTLRGTAKCNVGGKAVLLKGSDFNAKFEVEVPAVQPSAPSPIPWMIRGQVRIYFQVGRIKEKIRKCRNGVSSDTATAICADSK